MNDDRKREAKKRAAAERDSELDAKRRKFKEELETREKVHFAKREEKRRAELELQMKIERLRKQDKEMRRLQEENATAKWPAIRHGQTILLAKWKCQQDKRKYNENILAEIFKVAEECVVISPSVKNGTKKAKIAFSDPRLVQLALKVNIRMDYIQWIKRKRRDSRFSFCDYPFRLMHGSKQCCCKQTWRFKCM